MSVNEPTLSKPDTFFYRMSYKTEFLHHVIDELINLKNWIPKIYNTFLLNNTTILQERDTVTVRVKKRSYNDKTYLAVVGIRVNTNVPTQSATPAAPVQTAPIKRRKVLKLYS